MTEPTVGAAAAIGDEGSPHRQEEEEEEARTYLIVVRHGERIDYVLRDAGRNWVEEGGTSATGGSGFRPWDPPLSDHGVGQARDLGRHLGEVIRRMELPPVSAVYASPFVRCRQTAASALRELQLSAAAASETTEDGGTVDDTTEVLVRPNVKTVRVEEGLAESINESWYRSWCLPGTDGTWGYRCVDPSEKQDRASSSNNNNDRNDDYDYDATVVADPSKLHPAALEPVQSILRNWKDNNNKGSSAVGGDDLEDCYDLEYESRTKVELPYRFGPPSTPAAAAAGATSRLLETRKDQGERMRATVNALKEKGKTVVVVSHGGPVTHLYETLTGGSWKEHGPSTYCCYSIYRYRGGSSSGQSPDAAATAAEGDEDGRCWEALVVNESKFLKEQLSAEFKL